MTDIVDRLRHGAFWSEQDMQEAADKIEQLRSLLGLAADELYCASESLEYLGRPLWARRYAKVSDKLKEELK